MLNFSSHIIFLTDDVVDPPVTPFRSQGDLTRLMDNIHREQLTFDGKDKRKQRTSAILPVDDAPALPQDQIDAIKRKQTLLRTLKVKKRYVLLNPVFRKVLI